MIKYGIHATEPLLAKRIIVVEGKRDITILSQLIELRFNRTPDQLDIVIVSAEGKAGVVQLCGLLNSLGVDWIAVFDWDAVESKEVPHIIEGIDEKIINDAKVGINKILPIIDNLRRRGNRVYNSLKSIIKELENGRPLLKIYDDSYVKETIDSSKKLSKDEKSQLNQALKRGPKITYRKLLFKSNICLWSETIEETLISANGAKELIEQFYINSGTLSGPVFPVSQRKNRLKNLLKTSIDNSDDIKEILKELYTNGKLSRNDFKYALEFFTKGLI